MPYLSPLPDIVVPDITLTDYVLARAPELGDKPALIDGSTGRILTYAALDRAVHGLADGLHTDGFAAGDVLALLAPNVPEYAVVFHGVALAGGVLTTINPTYTAREVHNQLLDAGASRLVTVSPFLETCLEAVTGTAVRQVYLMDDVPDGAAAAAATAGVDLHPLTDMVSSSTRFRQVPVDTNDVVVLPYSSGTTGVSKGVMLSHRNLVANIAQVVPGADLREEEKLIAVLPFFHIYGMQVLMNCALRIGATAITMPRFDLEQFLDLHQRYGVTRSFVAPPIVVALAKHPLVDNYDLSALRQVFSGAAPLSAEVAQAAGERLGCEVVQGYGMTEMSPVSHLTPPGQVVHGSVGVLVAGTEMRIVDVATAPDHADRAPGEDGEVWIRGPQNMRGYLNNPQATALTIDEQGWLHTGRHRTRRFTRPSVHRPTGSRSSSSTRASRFAPAELEALLLTHPAITDAAVVGIADEEAGEVPAAFVVQRPGAGTSADEIMMFVAEQVAPFKQIRSVRFVEAIPKSASGKILRRMLRDTVATDD